MILEIIIGYEPINLFKNTVLSEKKKKKSWKIFVIKIRYYKKNFILIKACFIKKATSGCLKLRTVMQ